MRGGQILKEDLLRHARKSGCWTRTGSVLWERPSLQGMYSSTRRSPPTHATSSAWEPTAPRSAAQYLERADQNTCVSSVNRWVLPAEQFSLLWQALASYHAACLWLLTFLAVCMVGAVAR